MPDNAPIFHFAIDTRQSGPALADLGSYRVQFDACHSFLRAHKKSGRQRVGDRSDNSGRSGESLDRSALQRLLAKTRSGEINRLFVYRLDRLSRTVVQSALLLKKFGYRGVTYDCFHRGG